MKYPMLGLVSVVLLGGCAAHSYCAKPRSYESAESVPAVAAADGLIVKPSPNAYLIPPPPPDPVPFGQLVQDPNGRQEWSCLDEPPPFTPSVAPPPIPKS